jgi:hypothetical protein
MSFLPEQFARKTQFFNLPPSVTDLLFNTVLQGTVVCGTDVEVILEDSGGNPVTPDSVNLVGNTLTIVYDAPVCPTPSGVQLAFPNSEQYTSYRTGDEGWRTQNSWFNFTPPAYPAAIAELDYSAGANYFYLLKNNLRVGANSNKFRFVDVDGLQAFPSTLNKQLVVIDKLTGLMFQRTSNVTNAFSTWNLAIDNALAYSLAVNGITYDDWYLPSMVEHLAIFGNLATATNWFDANTGALIATIASGNHYTATTNMEVTTSAIMHRITSTGGTIENGAKTTGGRAQVYVRKAFNLISAP